MESVREQDKEMLMSLPSDKLLDLFFLQMRNLWAVDGLYFLGIEERFGTEAATEIDRSVWEVMGKIEAKRIKKAFGIEGKDLHSMIRALRLSSWSLDLEDKEIVEEEDRVIFRNIDCRVQRTRLKKGLSEFPCKSVRWGFLKSFAKEINENIEVACKVCPPDEHEEDLWCQWEFEIRG